MPVDPGHLADFAFELQKLLDDQIRPGNSVVETYRGWPGRDSIFVMLNPFP